MGVKHFTELLIWQRAREWSKAIFFLTQAEPFRSDRRLVEQVNDSSESVMSNIAEGFGRGLGGVALAALLGADRLLADAPKPRPDGGLHHKPKARRVVQLFMAGGASHVDLFDYKPELVKRHGQPSDFGEHVEAFQNGLGPWLKPVFDFKPHGRCGKLLGDVVAPLGAVVDEMAFDHNVVGTTGVHSQGTLLQTTGFNRPGFPAMGAWVSYGLGNISDNLPAFVVLPDP